MSLYKEQQLAYLLENVNGISFEFDLESNTFTYVSSNAENILGYPPEKWLNFDSWKRMIHPDDREDTASFCVNETQNGRNHYMEYRMVRADGSIIWVLESITLITDGSGRPVTIYGIILDHTALKTAQVQSEKEHIFLQSVIDNIQDPIMVIDENYTVILNNQASKKITSMHYVMDAKAPKCYELSHHRNTPCDGINDPCPLREVMTTQQPVRVIHNHPDTNGEIKHFELACAPIVSKENKFLGIIESARDVTEQIDTMRELKNKSAQLNYQAYHDSLTQLPNRSLFHDRLEQAIEKSKRHQRKLALIFIDLDNFKQINDTMGHDFGDKILIEAAMRLKKSIRSHDTLSRLGGDEFTIILEDLPKTQDCSLIAKKILKSFAAPFSSNGNDFHLSCSIGISIYPDDDESAGNLLKYADHAMYKAKDEGRNNFQFYSKKMMEKALKRMELERDLRKAIAKQAFVLHYQPIFDGISKKVLGVEALIRWRHKTLGLISPAEFIPLAEERGLIIDIDNWVMHTAMRQVKKWYAAGLNPGRLSLNLAIKNLESSQFMAHLNKALESESFDPAWLKLEVLERDVMRKPEENILKLKEIHGLGINLAIDDFGTGESSLTYLKRFPIDQLKIDQTFIRDTPSNEEERPLFRLLLPSPVPLILIRWQKV